MPDKQSDFSFEDFSSLDFYNEVNGRLLDLINIEKFQRIVDLGCGTGGVTQQILERVKSACGYVVYAVDHSATALKVAMSNLGKHKNSVVRFVQSEAQNVSSSIAEPVDAIVYCNSIHYIKDKHSALIDIGNKLRSGGILAVNTSFFAGDYPEGSKDFYAKWMLRSRRMLKREYNLSTDKSKVQSRVHLSREEYVSTLEDTGYRVENARVETFDVPFEGWHHISGFKDWIEGVMPGVPLDVGREILQKALRQIFDEYKITTVPRNWLSVTAIKI